VLKNGIEKRKVETSTEKQQLKVVMKNNVVFFFVPPGHIIQYFPVQALYPEP
jgi:hypothetical protein